MNQIYYQPQKEEIEIFTHASKTQLPVLLKGPTGCGKTRFVEYMAEKLGRKLYTVACHDDLTASDLVGRHLINQHETYWQDGPLTKAVREGGICYLDEVVEARKDTTVVIHPLTDNRRILPIDRTGEILKASPDFMLVVSYNPGYQQVFKGMKPSTRQRFVSMSFDYPEPELEEQILINECQISAEDSKNLVELAIALRRLKDYDLEESVSTRLLIYAATLIQSGLKFLPACQAAIIEPLTDDEETILGLIEVVKLYDKAP